ncbi:hypothetical protein SAMN05216267_100483 [Actinacidiphila rubida]|uniref:Uncharacterized protein n=2 Tax=Actinacidiphila rubida TaxID=310780 RepID=A0A1H8FUP7_9ACTN|nr:hypothetical protein SAMN05216267_100483 [Actinacidiphila rubida]
MDAARLVAEAERRMRGCPRPEDVLAEAWQAYELAGAVGLLLAEGAGPGSGRRRGPGLPPGAATGAGPPRAARLTGVRDAPGTLRALHVLLGEIGLALVGLTSSAEDEAAYWQCIEALDAVDEAKDAVRGLARDEGG